MYPFGSIPSNLVAFGDVLRKEYDFKIGPRELEDAARVLEIVDLGDEGAVRNALRPILSKTRDDASVFDQAFGSFFLPAPTVPKMEHGSTGREPEGSAQTEGRFKQEAEPEQEADKHRQRDAAPSVAPLISGKPEVAPGLLARASYSPLEAETDERPQLRPAAPAWRNAARQLVRVIDRGLMRRWRPARRGPRFDLRRTLRTSLETGGEALNARWLRRPRRNPRFMLLIDGSRSMGPYAQAALEIAVAIATVTTRVDVFVFSTGLLRVTQDVRRAAAGEFRNLDRLENAWAGGTAIGRCLRDFQRRFGGPMTSRDTVLIIVSDGLDVGEPDVLRQAMNDLHRKSAAVVWLNPLIATPGYEPAAQGMSTARPYITTFSAANDLVGFTRLSRRVRLRA